MTFGFIALLAAPWTPRAQEKPQSTEMERLLQCDRDLCAIVTDPAAGGPPLRCDLETTWHKEDIAKAVGKGRLSWPFGDARCSAKLDVSRDLLANAIKETAYTLQVPPQPVSCEVDNEGTRHHVTTNMAPVIEFKDGKATSVSLGIGDIEGNAIVRNVLWAAWKFESYFGYFREDFVNGVNGYIVNWCPNREAGPGPN